MKVAKRKRKKGSHGKQKGAQFERDVCKLLSRWVDPSGTDTHFWRSAMSGGRATILHRQGKTTKSQAGDISATGRKGTPLLSVFFVECKFYKDLALMGAILNGTGKLANFWEIAVEEAVKHEKRPLLIVKQNGSAVFALLDTLDAASRFQRRKPRAILCRLKFNSHMVGLYELADLFRKPFASHRF